jgi:hypothetical protein
LAGEGLVECKPRQLVASDENQRKFKAADDWCKNQGWEFLVVTDEELRAGYRLKNIKLLTRYARTSVTPESIPGILQRISSNGAAPITLLEAASLVQPDHIDQGIAMLLHLAFYHWIVLPLEMAPISESTLVEITGRQYEYLPV